MSYKDDVRNLLEDIRDLLSDLENDDEIEWSKANTVISLLSEAESDIDEALKMI